MQHILEHEIIIITENTKLSVVVTKWIELGMKSKKICTKKLEIWNIQERTYYIMKTCTVHVYYVQHNMNKKMYNRI